MHGIDQFFVGLAEAITSMWRGRALLFRPSLFEDPAARRRSQIFATVACVLATLILVALGLGVLGLFWWAFTRHEQM